MKAWMQIQPIMPNKNTANSGSFDRGFIENITRFSNLLRDNGVAVSLPAVLDTLRGLALIDIFYPDEFKYLLQVNLICPRDDLAIFSKLFDEFWYAQYHAPRKSAAEQKETPQADYSLL
jgi:uncharacterized protein with von Willebrand factor type A (vWA) domain